MDFSPQILDESGLVSLRFSLHFELMDTHIYVLICPVDGEIKYVGKSNDPERRLKDHMIDYRVRLGEYRKVKWLSDLAKKKLKPELLVVDIVDIQNWKFWEKWWIQYFKSLGCNLLNNKSGGNGLSVGNDYTFKAGHKPWNLGIKTGKKWDTTTITTKTTQESTNKNSEKSTSNV